MTEPWQSLSEGAALLRAGAVVGIPTETVYGLAARIDDIRAIEKIFELKARPLFDPLIVHVARSGDLADLVLNIPPVITKLIEQYWPGPLTVVIPKAAKVNALITSGLDTVAVRCPAHPFARRLIQQATAALAAPSANLHKQTSATSAAAVREQFGDEVFVVDGGPCEVGIESTVVAYDEVADALLILRPGMVTKWDLEQIHPRVRFEQSDSSPGSMKEHYMPKVPLFIVDSTPDEETVGVLKRRYDLLSSSFVTLPLEEDSRLAARFLYARMQSADSGSVGFQIVIRSSTQSGDAWEAIWNRLSKAATADLTAPR